LRRITRRPVPLLMPADVAARPCYAQPAKAADTRCDTRAQGALRLSSLSHMTGDKARCDWGGIVV
jgi:hypothetical protein